MSSQWTYPFGVYVRVGATLAVALAWLRQQIYGKKWRRV